MGTLCLIDTQPRELDDSDILALKSLAEMVEAELNAVQIATIDELTGVANRRGFELLAEQCLQLCQRKNFTVSCAFLDLDKFKPINDTYGHQEGDRALKIFTSHLQQSLRQSDLVARIGGDEFIALMPDCTTAQAGESLDRLKQTLAQYCEEINLAFALVFSAGIVEYDPSTHKGIDALIKDADQAMYRAKELH